MSSASSALPAKPTRVVIIGGFGNFGARICRRLGSEANIEVLATARVVRGPAPGNAKGAPLDITASSFRQDLEALKPSIVIHCAGPFQGQSYEVADAALACGAHYLDLADGREFVKNFSPLVGCYARASHRTAICGASTLPALSCAVVDSLSLDFEQLESIDIVIAPGQHAPRGTATLAAVLGYAGQAIPWWVGGHWTQAYGWQNLKKVPLPFGDRWAAACDVPDLELFPALYPGVQTVTFRAALEVPVQHAALWALAALRRAGFALPLSRWAARLNRLGDRLNRFGGDAGGMRVEVVGRLASGVRKARTWVLTAKAHDGPEIPCMAAIILCLRLARGEALPVGAFPCTRFVTLSEFEAEFARWRITTDVSSSDFTEPG